MIIAIDFDGTIVEHRFPEIGDPVPYALNFIKALKENGHQIFLWTIRSNYEVVRFDNGGKVYQRRIESVYLDKACQFLKENGIELDGYNESPYIVSTSNKQFANYYIDDTALGTPMMKDSSGHYSCVDWKELGKLMVQKHLISELQYAKIIHNDYDRQ